MGFFFTCDGFWERGLRNFTASWVTQVICISAPTRCDYMRISEQEARAIVHHMTLVCSVHTCAAATLSLGLSRFHQKEIWTLWVNKNIIVYVRNKKPIKKINFDKLEARAISFGVQHFWFRTSIGIIFSSTAIINTFILFWERNSWQIYRKNESFKYWACIKPTTNESLTNWNFKN